MLILILIVFLTSTLLFYRAAGTLNPGKLNIVSYVFFVFMLQSFAGASLITLGFDEHYTLSYLLNRETSIRITGIVIALTAIALPLFILLFEKIFRTNVRVKYNQFLKSKTIVGNSQVFFLCLCIVSAICGLLLIGFLVKVGYLPLWRLFFSPEGFNSATERIRISNLYFINSYVTNILILSVIPFLSYISFAYMITLMEQKWIVLAGVLFILSVVVKTYKFEKSPLVFHFLGYILIYIYFKGGIRFIYMIVTAAVLAGIIILAYFATGFTGSILDIYNGPLGRILFTEVGTLAYCFDLFPEVFGFLGGRSFTPTILKLIGIDPYEHLRSAKLTMAFYGSEKVYDGSAGVMNSLFVGEAYSNWGIPGVVVSVIWVGFVIALLMTILLKMKKTPATISLMALVSIKIGTLLEGGFCDFVYNFDLIFTFASFILIYYCFEHEGKIQQFVTGIIGKIIRCGQRADNS